MVSPTAARSVVAAVDAPGAFFADCPVRAIRAAAASKLSAARFIPYTALERLIILILINLIDRSGKCWQRSVFWLCKENRRRMVGYGFIFMAL